MTQDNNQKYAGKQACIKACHSKPAWRNTVVAAHFGLGAAGIWQKHQQDHSQAFSSQIREIRLLWTRASLTNTHRLALRDCLTSLRAQSCHPKATEQCCS